MFRALFSACLVLGLAASAFAQDPEANVEKAKKAYSDANEKARNHLLDAFANAIKTATASGSLDVVKALQAEKEAFEASGKIPASARMRTAAVNYLLATKQASTVMEKAYEQAIKDFTKAGKLTQAEAAQAELKEFRTKAVGNLRAADVMTKEDLHKYLSETVWAWDDGLKLKADGSTEQRVWQSNGLVTKWEAVDRRTIVLWIEKGRDNNRIATMTFNEDLTEGRGFSFDGTKSGALKRK